ncbi:Protein sprint, partial [Armadillidium nasatum]
MREREKGREREIEYESFDPIILNIKKSFSWQFASSGGKYFISDGVCEGMLMEAVREPIVLPSSGIKSPQSSSGAIFVRPPKPVSFPSPTDRELPSSSCYRRAASVSRHPSSGGYRTAGVYRSRSGSVPPPTEGGSTGGGGGGGGGVTSPREREQQFPTAAAVSAQQPYTPSEAESLSEICAISTEERLLKTNPIWFLADLQRKGAVHLLQGKEEGSFLVRQSSQTNTLAISVRLPPDKGPHNFGGLLLASPSSPPVLSPPARLHDLSFSSFGKAGVSNRMGITSPILASTTSCEALTPSRPAPPLPSSMDRSCLNLNLASLEDVYKDSTTNAPTPTFSSFKTSSNTPLTPVGKPFPPNRVSPPNVPAAKSNKPPPPIRSSPPNSDASQSPSSSSNITVTTTLTFNVNQVKGFVPLPFNGVSSPQTSTPSPHEDTFQVHVSSLEISPSSKEGLTLHFRPPSYSSPPSHPPTPLTPLSEDGSERKIKQKRSKPVAPPKIKGKDLPNWVDASWEFLTYVGPSQGEALTPGSLTAQALIEQRLPHLVGGSDTTSSLRHSAYDNVSRRTSSLSDSGTEFSEPWDSRKWDMILNDSRNGSKSPESLVQVTGDSESNDSDGGDSVESSGPVTLSLSQKTNNYDTNLRSKILSPQMLALRHRKDAESGAAVRRYALSLGHDSSTTFSKAIKHFLTCTLEGSEREAAVVVRNLKSNEFLNLDAILEDVLVRLVLRPLWTHINQLFVDALTSNGSIQRLADNISYAKNISDVQLGIRDGMKVTSHGVLRVLVPDEKSGSIATRTLPIRPGCTARELCRMMAHKLRVTNPQDFALYKLIDGNVIRNYICISFLYILNISNKEEHIRSRN